MSRTVIRSLFLVAALASVACSSSEEPPAGPGPIKAAADAPKSGAWLGLEARIEGDELVVDVVGHDVPELSGVALRVEHPEWAKLNRRDVAPGWDAAAIHLVKSTSSKEVAIVDTVKGEKVGRPGGAKVVLDTLRFSTAGAPTSGDLGALRIVGVRTELRDASGKVVPVQVAGAKLSR